MSAGGPAYRYRLYGLAVVSDRPVPMAEPGGFEGAPDLHVQWKVDARADVDWRLLQPVESARGAYPKASVVNAGGEWLTKVRYYADDRAYLLANNAADRISVVHAANMARQDLDSLFIGPLLGATLRMRGDLVLHASVVEIAGAAVALVGRSRSGKSTHAAALVRRGSRALADDLARITPGPAGYEVHSGYSMLRLRPGAAELVDPGYETRLAQVYSFRDSFYAPLGEAFYAGALPLAAIYLLGPGRGVSALDPAQAVPRLSRNLFADYVARSEAWPSCFEGLCRLAADVPVKSLGVSRDMTDLDSQVQALLADIGETCW